MKKKNFFLLVMVSVLVLGACSKKQNLKHDSDVSSDGTESSVFTDEPFSRGDSDKDSNLKIVYFDFDRSDLTANSLEALKENAAYLIRNPDIKVVLEGHTDERGTTEYNLSLGQRRALKVKEYYTQLGVAANRIATISYGKEKPADSETNELAWARNRRVETKSLMK
ncbi:MAG: peptidoglycan-associated lipoprotein Pal [Endomicrobium sp.]|jgi:peptidoglycan-associated lipoprotein|nr:peptidoglycan-associated lipoprotein Pal [Endomicrobium sp.]